MIPLDTLYRRNELYGMWREFFDGGEFKAAPKTG